MTYMTHNCIIEMFVMKVFLTTSNAYGKGMYKETIIVLTLKTLLSGSAILLNLGNMVRN